MQQNDISVEIQEFYNDKYFKFDSIVLNNKTYHIYAKLDNPKQILVAKLIMKDNEEYYEVVKDEEYLEVISMFKRNK